MLIGQSGVWHHQCRSEGLGTVHFLRLQQISTDFNKPMIFLVPIEQVVLQPSNEQTVVGS